MVPAVADDGDLGFDAILVRLREVVQRLEDPGLEDLVRRRVAEKLLRAEEQVKEFIGERS